MTKKRVGIYAGTFDPIHVGHVAFSKQSIEAAGLDKVFFLVEPEPWRKQGVRALIHRQEMVQQVIANDERLGSIVLDHTGPVTVQQTLPRLKRLFSGAQLYILMGTDVFKYVSQWPDVAELIKDCQFVVGVRNDEDTATARDQEHALHKAYGVHINVEYVHTTESGMNSTNIRLAYKNGTPVKGLLPVTEQYIRENGLYANQE